MKFSEITAEAPALMREDGLAVNLDAVVDLLVIRIKEHGHFGNVLHHVAKGDWAAVRRALGQIVIGRQAANTLTGIAPNLVRLLAGKGSPNIRPFGAWLLTYLEAESSTLFRHLVARRIATLNAEIEAQSVRFRTSALRAISHR